MNPNHYSPKEFLRARRPERFSDSIIEEMNNLDRSILEYHLDTLTNRNQERDFELFCRRIAEREICPNLSPQTGPTGGGDSKVDSETYPVADGLSLGWYTGIGREAASERWAFAFSAKEEWRGKVRSDISKIAATNRGYSKAFFISNQYIRDKVRGEREDELSTKHGLDVRILDRTWILDKVFSNGHEQLAIETLKLETSLRKQIRKGPLDIQREADLNNLEELIKKKLEHQRFSIQLVKDCIDAAILSRELERPRTEVEGRFERAERIAAKYGTSHQRLQSAYQKAWTVFWWYEDFQLFNELYCTVEQRATGSRNVYDLELLMNLWYLLHALIGRKELSEDEAKYEGRTQFIKHELERLSMENDRPSTSLQARTMLLQIKLTVSMSQQVLVGPVLQDLRDVVLESKGLVGYPLEPLVQILTELGDFLGNEPAYDELFETIIEVSSSRKEEVSAARMLLKRGKQQLDAEKPYDAIRWLGRALRYLYNHESRNELIRALYLCGYAYERVGLLWAARGAMLIAASIATDEFWKHSNVTPVQFECYRRLKWLELQLGRIPHSLAWYEADSALGSVLFEQGYQEQYLREDYEQFDRILGLLLLKTEFGDLKRIEQMPDILDQLGLVHAAVALLYALGYEEELQDENIPESKEQDIYNTFLMWRNQPAANDLPETPAFYDVRRVILSSSILGCKITVKSDNELTCLTLSESMLAALESFLATGTVDQVVAREPELTINVRTSDFTEIPFRFELQNQDGRPYIDVVCRKINPHRMSLENQVKMKEKLSDLLFTIVGRILMLDKPQEFLENLFRDERAHDRSINFTSSFSVISNVLGDEPKFELSNWSDSNARVYSLKRLDAWDAADQKTNLKQNNGEQQAKLIPGEEHPPKEIISQNNTKHSQIHVESLIRETLWDKASWSGTVFLYALDYSAIPILAPVFNDEESSKQIFTLWRQELGTHDTEEKLRISIIRGIDKSNPYAYRVVFGSNMDTIRSKSDTRYITMVFRINTMVPSSPRNLEHFLRNYYNFGEYLLAPAVAREKIINPDIFFDYGLNKRELYIRNAWEIGRNDTDSCGIKKDDRPIIPEGVNDPPIRELLEWKRERKST